MMKETNFGSYCIRHIVSYDLVKTVCRESATMLLKRNSRAGAFIGGFSLHLTLDPNLFKSLFDSDIEQWKVGITSVCK